MSGRDKIKPNRAVAGGQATQFRAMRSGKRLLVPRSGLFGHHQAQFEESSGECRLIPVRRSEGQRVSTDRVPQAILHTF